MSPVLVFASRALRALVSYNVLRHLLIGLIDKKQRQIRILFREESATPPLAWPNRVGERRDILVISATAFLWKASTRACDVTLCPRVAVRARRDIEEGGTNARVYSANRSPNSGHAQS